MRFVRERHLSILLSIIATLSLCALGGCVTQKTADMFPKNFLSGGSADALPPLPR